MKKKITALFLIFFMLMSSVETVLAFDGEEPTEQDQIEQSEQAEQELPDSNTDNNIDSSTENSPELLQGFVDEENGRFYYEQGVKFIPEKAGIYSVEDASYYFFEDGSVKTVSEAGVHKIGSKRYYFNLDHSIKTVTSGGTYKVNGKYYYFNEADYVQYPGKGKRKVNGKYYYFNEDTSLFVDGWKTIDGKTSYFAASGAKTGRVKIDDYYYYFNDYANLITSKTAKRAILKKNGKYFEIRKQAKQDVGGYDTLQGSCTDGTYSYYILYNRVYEKCKIVKVKISNKKVIKVSKPLNIAHGNGIAYDAKNKRLVVVHNTLRPTTLSVIDRNKLCVKRVVNVKIPSTIPGATDKQVKNIKKFGSISYNRSRDVYVVLLSSSHDLLTLNADFKPIAYTKLSDKPKYIYQCIDVTDHYIMIGMSPRYADQYNHIAVYEWDGTHRFDINIQKSYELESIYHIGSKIYAGFYRSFYQTYYKTIKKTYKKNGKTVVKKIKQKNYRLQRSNYVYQLSDYTWKII